ncbi:MAG: GuaB1 family IMP dehydrogenase-related protein, partial [Leucobacter sp.]|nr:GuaB1 family IMP dehydrogenase-related protein [Leucobacter sp.]
MQFIGSQPTVDLTYSDVFLVPRRSHVVSRLDVDLTPGDGTPATLPLVASNMNSVTGPRLAAVMARRGGLGVLPQDMAPEQLIDAIRWVKRQPVDCDTPVVLPPHATVADARRFVPPVAGFGVVVAEITAPSGMLPSDFSLRVEDVLGVVPAARLQTAPADTRLADLIHSTLHTIEANTLGGERAAFDAALAAEAQHNAEMLAVVDGDAVVGTIQSRSALRSTLY